MTAEKPVDGAPVVVIDVDSLRPDHMGTYGYGPATTPHLDDLARDATVFERAYAANSPCMPARAGLLTGRYGIANGVETHKWQGRSVNGPHTWPARRFDGDPADYHTLPERFFEAGRAAAAVSSFPRHPAPWFYHVWDEVHQPREPDAPGEYFQTPRAAAVVDRAIDLLDRRAPELLYVQLWDPHTPYNRSDAEVAAFADAPLPPHPTDAEIAAHREWDTWRGARDTGIEDREDLQAVLAAYDAEIGYADAQIGRLLDTLREYDRYDESLVVVLADHGEEFGEHGCYREHWSTHEGTQRVPLLVKPPADAPRRDRSRALVTNVDVAATVLAYAGLEVPDAWHGTSLRPHVADAAGGTDGEDRSGPSATATSGLSAPPGDGVDVAAGPNDFLVVDHGLYTAQRAVRTDRWKLVRTYEAGLWEPVVPEVQLFDLDADPWEVDNCADEYPDVVDALSTLRARWVDRHVGPDGDALRTAVRNGLGGPEIYGDAGSWDGI
jgi:arylsulfatase A-like enzyme